MIKKSSVVDCRRKVSVLDVQVAYDALVRHCVASFNANGSLSPAIVSISLGCSDGEVTIMGVLDIKDYENLTSEGKNGPLMGDFFHRALVDEDFRSSVTAQGHCPADMLAFISEIAIYRAKDENGNVQEDEAVMLSLHTADRSFQSLFAIERDPEPRIFYTPLQTDFSSSCEAVLVDDLLSLEKIPSSNRALMAAYPVQDLHVHAGIELH